MPRPRVSARGFPSESLRVPRFGLALDRSGGPSEVGDLPEPRGPIEARGHDHLAVGDEGQVGDRAPMGELCGDRPAGRHVPESRGTVAAAGHDRLAVGAKATI